MTETEKFTIQYCYSGTKARAELVFMEAQRTVSRYANIDDTSNVLLVADIWCLTFDLQIDPANLDKLKHLIRRHVLYVAGDSLRFNDRLDAKVGA